MRIDKDQLKVFIVLALVVGGFAVGIWMPARQQRRVLQDRIDQAEQKLRQARESPSLKKWNKTVASLEQQLASSRQRVPPRNELATVLRGLSEVLSKRNVMDQSVSTAPAQRFGSFGVTPITVKFRGSFPDAHAVVQRIEQMPRLIQVDRFEVDRGEVTESGPVRVYLELSAFFSRKASASTDANGASG